LARAPLREPSGRNAGVAALDREAVLLEDAGQILRRLDFLESELAEAEDLVDHLLRECRQRVDEAHRFGLEARDALVVGRQCDGEGIRTGIAASTAAALREQG